MARSAVPCMFCGELPCVCKKKAVPKPRAKKPRLETESVTLKPIQLDTIPPVEYESDSQRIVPSLSAKEAMKKRAAKKAAKDKPAASPLSTSEDIATHTELTPDEIEFNAAVKALEPILHPTERRRYMKIIESETDYRVAAWKLKIKEESGGV